MRRSWDILVEPYVHDSAYIPFDCQDIIPRYRRPERRYERYVPSAERGSLTIVWDLDCVLPCKRCAWPRRQMVDRLGALCVGPWLSGSPECV